MQVASNVKPSKQFPPQHVAVKFCLECEGKTPFPYATFRDGVVCCRTCSERHVAKKTAQLRAGATGARMGVCTDEGWFD